jgi:hypothetical protein
MPKAFARIDVRGLNRLRREVSEGLNGKTGGPIDTMLKNWGLFYLRKCQDAFRRNSAGGGDWPPLALVTIEKTRDLPRKGILRINSDVYFALFPGEAGNVFRRTPKGILVGFGGPGRHSFYRNRGPNQKSVTVAQVAMWHNEGTKRMPRRRILLEPDQVIAAQMREEAIRAFQDLVRKGS